jgi:hypothetical protein
MLGAHRLVTVEKEEGKGEEEEGRAEEGISNQLVELASDRAGAVSGHRLWICIFIWSRQK